MSDLTGQVIANTYKDILQMSGGLNEGITTALKELQDGEGTASSILISESKTVLGSLEFTGSNLSHRTGGVLNMLATTTFNGGTTTFVNDTWSQSDALISGDLTVSGVTTTDVTNVQGTLAVSGASSLVGDVTMGADAEVEETLTVGTEVICPLGDFDTVGVDLVLADDVTVAGWMTVAEYATITGNITGLGNLAITGSGSFGTTLDVGGALDVVGNAVFGADTTMQSNIYATGEFFTSLVPNPATITLGTDAKRWNWLFSDNITNTSNIVSGGLLTVDGIVTFTSDVALSVDFQVAGDFNLDGIFTMGDGGPVTIDSSGNFAASGWGSFGEHLLVGDHLIVGDYATIGDYLTAAGTITGNANLSIATTGLFGTDVNIGQDLAVVRDTDLGRNLQIDGDMQLDGVGHFVGTCIIYEGIRPNVAGGSTGPGTTYVGNVDYPFDSMNVGDIYIASVASNAIQTSRGDLKLMSTTGTVEITTNLNLSAGAGEHTINGKWIGSHIPKTDDVYTIGTSTLNWKELYIGKLLASLKISSAGGNPTIETSRVLDVSSGIDLILTGSNSVVLKTTDIDSTDQASVWDIKTAESVSLKVRDNISGTDYIGFDTSGKYVNIYTAENITGKVTHVGDYSINGDIDMENGHTLTMTNSGQACDLTSNGTNATLQMSTNGIIIGSATLLLYSPATTISGTLNVQGAADLDSTLNVDNISHFQAETIHEDTLFFPNNNTRIVWNDGVGHSEIKADTVASTAELGGELQIKHSYLVNHFSPKSHFNNPTLWGSGNFLDQYSLRAQTNEGLATNGTGVDGSFQHLGVSSSENYWQNYAWIGCATEQPDSASGGVYLYD